MFEIMVMTVMVMITGSVIAAILETVTKDKMFRALVDETRHAMAAVAGATIGWFEFERANPFIQTPFLALMLLMLATSIMVFFSNLLYALLKEMRRKLR